jgi:PPOX class probable F420-dependent enzyme
MQPTPEQEAILAEEPLGILATVKKDGSPQLTPIYYAYQDGQIIISITKTRAKYHNVRRNPMVSLCVVKEGGRPYVTVYGRAEIEEDDIVDGTKAIFKRFNPADPPDNFEQALRDQQRVLLKITPETFTP